jgi:hypothetical protein
VTLTFADVPRHAGRPEQLTLWDWLSGSIGILAPVSAHRYGRPVTSTEFVQRVRRHAPSSLLLEVAGAGARYNTPQSWLDSPYKKLTPWALAEVARISLLQGNEHRAPADARDLLECCAAYSGITDPDLRTQTVDAFIKFMLRTSGEQMTYQVPIRGELARSIALFEQTVTDVQLEVLHGDWAAQLFHCSIAEYVGVAFLIGVIAQRNAGRFDFRWFEQDSFAPILAGIGADTIQRVARRHFITTQAELWARQAEPAKRVHPNVRRLQFNPLEARPVVEGVVDTLLIPVPGLLVRKVSPLGIYYSGLEHFGEAFARDLGWLFEAYVGRQLQQMHSVTVHPSVQYGRDKRQSVDWIAVFDGVTVLFEVKSARPTEAVRIGSDEAAAALRRSLGGKAIRQIDVTAGLIRDQHEAFRFLPHYQPIVGLVVTLEPFHVINAPMYRPLLPQASVPLRFCAAFELEQLVMTEDRTVGEILLAYVQEPDAQDWAIEHAMDRHAHSFRRNVMLDEAWAALPWSSERGDTATAQ